MDDTKKPETGADAEAGAKAAPQTPPAQDPPPGDQPGGPAAGAGAKATEPAPAKKPGAAGRGGGKRQADTRAAAQPETRKPKPRAPDKADLVDEAELDPRLVAARPTFTRDDAFERAVDAIGEPVGKDVHVALREVFDRAVKSRSMAAETAWRMLHGAAQNNWPAWEDRDKMGVINLTIFIAVALALAPVADAQQAAFDQVQAELKSEGRLGAMRKAQAARRFKKAEKLQRKPEAMRQYIDTRAANRKAQKEGDL